MADRAGSGWSVSTLMVLSAGFSVRRRKQRRQLVSESLSLQYLKNADVAV